MRTIIGKSPPSTGITLSASFGAHVILQRSGNTISRTPVSKADYQLDEDDK
jgi:hypothetical protein